MHLIASNYLAFPNAKSHASLIHTLIRQSKIVELEAFLNENDCFANSITTSDHLFSATTVPTNVSTPMDAQ